MLVGDAAYYERFGSRRTASPGLWMPGPFERERFLGLASRPARSTAPAGLCRQRVSFEPKPDLAALVAAASQGRPGAFSLAA